MHAGPMQLPPEISAIELKRRLDASEPIRLIDVRTPEEHQAARIEAAQLIPLQEIPARIAELDADSAIVVHCKSGGRSSQAVAFLRQQGFKNVANLRGGILDWAATVDPSLKVV